MRFCDGSDFVKDLEEVSEPFSSEDIKNINTMGNSQKPHVYNKIFYGPKERDKDKVDKRLYNVRTKINFRIALPNIILLGTTDAILNGLFSSFSRMNPGVFSDIIRGAACIDQFFNVYRKSKQSDQNNFLSRKFNYYKAKEAPNIKDDTPDAERKFFIGGDAINYMVKFFFKQTIEGKDGNPHVYSIHDEIAALIRRECGKTFDRDTKKMILGEYEFEKLASGDAKKIEEYQKETILGQYIRVSEDKDYVESHKDEGWQYFFDRYYVTSEFDIDVEKALNQILVSDTEKGKPLNALKVMLTYRDNPRKFNAYALYSIPVLPIGLRPLSQEGRPHPISYRYNDLLKANKRLKEQISGRVLISDIMDEYRKVYLEFQYLVLKQKTYEDYKPLKEELVGKKGLVRSKLMSTVIDYSTRTVIISDMDIPVDSVGVPRYTLRTCCPGIDFKNTTIYCKIGRQPTLYLHSAKGFKVIPVDGEAIRLNPLITPPFNADFDGDQMYAAFPQSLEANKELEILMGSMNNFFHPKDGSCVYSLRHEMIYAMHSAILSVSNGGEIKTFDTVEDFKSDILNDIHTRNINIMNPCVVEGKKYKTIAYAITRIFTPIYATGIVPLTKYVEGMEEKQPKESFYKELFKAYKNDLNVDELVETLTNLVKVSLYMGYYFTVEFEVLRDFSISSYIDDFYSSIKRRRELYNKGFDTEDSYSSFYSEQYNNLEEKVKAKLREDLSDSPIIGVVDSGARGSMSNLYQMYGIKGMVQKNSVESFNTIIANNYTNGLSGLEHFITAYGGRLGIIDKTIRTHEPGYISRQMATASRHMVISSKDCATNNGLLLTYDKFVDNLGFDQSYDSYKKIKELVVGMIKGRFIVGSDSMITSDNEAEKLFEEQIAVMHGDSMEKKAGLKLRSPLTCADPCCAKCYGLHLVTGKLPAVGEPVGFLAGPTIGEPMTQLIMKNFQKGGVAGSKNITTSFDTMSAILGIRSENTGSRQDNVINYDFISPYSGIPKLEDEGEGVSRLLILNEDGKNQLHSTYKYPTGTKLKEYVEEGESVLAERGTYDINEVLKVRGVEAAIEYLLFQAYYIFAREMPINFKHFEVLIDGMILNLCTRGNGEFVSGCYYSNIDIRRHNTTGATFKKILRGLKYVNLVNNDFYTSMSLEDLGKAISINYLLSGGDSETDPLAQVILGKEPLIGAGINPNYLNERN